MITRCVLNKRFGMIVSQLRLDMPRQIGSKPMHSGASLARAIESTVTNSPKNSGLDVGQPRASV